MSLWSEPRHAELRTRFYRLLAVMLGSGVPLVRALDVLAQQFEDREFASHLQRAGRMLLEGYPLSKAMSASILPSFQLHLLAVGERTGSLQGVLERLGADSEKGQKTLLKIFSALTYPCVVLVTTLLLVVASQHFVLAGLLRFLQSLDVPLPWTTRVLVVSSAAVEHPLLWLVGALLLWAGLTALARSRERWRPLLYSTPGVGLVLRSALTLRYVRALALCLRVGVPVVQALQLLRQLDPLLETPGEAVLHRLREGDTLSEAWRATDFFPSFVGSVLKAGEESGSLPRLLESAAELTEVSLEETLQSLTAALQPAVMLGVGLLVGFVLVGTLSPLLSVVQSF